MHDQIDGVGAGWRRLWRWAVPLSDRGRDLTSVAQTGANAYPCGVNLGTAAVMSIENDHTLAPPAPLRVGDGNGSTDSARFCPLCDTGSDSGQCPVDGMATLLRRPPSFDVATIGSGLVIGGRYVVRGELGRGGFGAVFRCQHTGTGQDVAVKVLAVADAGPEMLARFFREARVTAGLKHPNTIRVFDFGQDDNGLVFLAMELLAGHALADELRARKHAGRAFAEREACEIAIAVLRSLAEAHSVGLVHRDLKPHNIFLHQVAGDDPVVKVLDFGIAKSEGSAMTQTGAVLGTPAYMSAEQAQSLPVDARSDLYSLAVVLWELVTGALPFSGQTPVQTLYMHAFTPLPPLGPLARERLSPPFVAVIEKALQKQPADRFADAAEMRTALATALGRTTSASVTVTPALEMAGAAAESAATATGLTPVTRRDQPDQLPVAARPWPAEAAIPEPASAPIAAVSTAENWHGKGYFAAVGVGFALVLAVLWRGQSPPLAPTGGAVAKPASQPSAPVTVSSVAPAELPKAATTADRAASATSSASTGPSAAPTGPDAVLGGQDPSLLGPDAAGAAPTMAAPAGGAPPPVPSPPVPSPPVPSPPVPNPPVPSPPVPSPPVPNPPVPSPPDSVPARKRPCDPFDPYCK
ncbi:MAG: serine/threonine protein kinase [Myxococcales bacterium]|nr:serine/threonine protein kinase [Myxococcales bacterium]